MRGPRSSRATITNVLAGRRAMIAACRRLIAAWSAQPFRITDRPSACTGPAGCFLSLNDRLNRLPDLRIQELCLHAAAHLASRAWQVRYA